MTTQTTTKKKAARRLVRVRKHVKAYGASVGVYSEDQTYVIRTLKSGLPVASFQKLQRAVGITAAQLAAVVNISPRTFSRRKAGGRLQTDESDRLFRTGRLFDMAIELFEDRALAQKWFTTPKRALGGKSPLAYADTGPGAKEVEDLMGRLEHGVYS